MGAFQTRPESHIGGARCLKTLILWKIYYIATAVAGYHRYVHFAPLLWRASGTDDALGVRRFAIDKYLTISISVLGGWSTGLHDRRCKNVNLVAGRCVYTLYAAVRAQYYRITICIYPTVLLVRISGGRHLLETWGCSCDSDPA